MNQSIKTDKETVERITNLLAPAGEVRTRNMMGGYLVYLDEVLIGQINNNKLHIKVTPYGQKYTHLLTKAEPYPGAKMAFEVSENILKEADWLVDFVQGTRDYLGSNK